MLRLLSEGQLDSFYLTLKIANASDVLGSIEIEAPEA